MLAGIPIGAAMVLVFQGWISYLGDCYRLYSSSAVGAFLRARNALSPFMLTCSGLVLHTCFRLPPPLSVVPSQELRTFILGTTSLDRDRS